MKTFLNVLYRKILYKIPLKFLLLILFIIGVLYYNYSSAYYVEDYVGANLSLNGGQLVTNYYTNDSGFHGKSTFCFINRNDPVCNFTATSTYDGQSVTINKARQIGCLTGITINSQYGINIKNNSDSFCQAMGAILLDGQLLYPQYTSLQCQTEYNLIPISSVDQNYCTTNNLCPSQDCSVCPPSGGSGFSNVYINDILHIGAPNIIMNISEEIDWDYGYTAGGNNMNIDVVGYNVDYDKIDSIVDNQSYKPSSEDFANILGILAPYTKIIVFFVFLFLVWAWIKKPFKSKKL